MKVEAILRKKGRSVQTILPWSTVAEALHRMAGPPRIGALVVTESDGHIAGMITERDIIRELERHPDQLLERPVSYVMGRHVPVCFPQHSIEQVMLQMTRLRYRRLSSEVAWSAWSVSAMWSNTGSTRSSLRRTYCGISTSPADNSQTRRTAGVRSRQSTL